MPEESLFVTIALYMLRDESVRTMPKVRLRAGSSLLRLALAHHFATDPADWQLGRAASGARIVVGGPLSATPLSLAHTDDLLLAAVADAQTGTIGVDIERLRLRRYAAIARHLSWPASFWHDDAPTREEFLHLWTLWEALFKSMPGATFPEVRAAFGEQAGRVRAGIPGALRAGAWCGQSWQCPGLCWLSIVAQSAQWSDVRLFRVDRLAGDVESARITIITTAESKFNF